MDQNGSNDVHNNASAPAEGPGASRVGVTGIVTISAYLLAWAGVCFYALIVLWPTPTPARTEAAPAGQTTASAAPAGASATPGATPPANTGGARDDRPTPLPAVENVARRGPNDGATATQAVDVPRVVDGRPAPPVVCAAGEPCWVELFFWRGYLWDEQRLLLLVLLSGALGALVHALRSLYWYTGNRNLIRSWTSKYAILPFAGSALALIF